MNHGGKINNVGRVNHGGSQPWRNKSTTDNPGA